MKISMDELLSQLDCYNKDKDNDNDDKVEKNVNFLSFAHGDKYEAFLPLYTFFALQSNANSIVEMVVNNRDHFIASHHQELSWLLLHGSTDTDSDTNYGSALCVSNVKPSTMKRTKTTNTWRYLEPPARHAKYTYIGDIDVFLYESVVESKRLAQMQHFNLPYSNIVRPNTTRLTGLMLMNTNDYYTNEMLKVQQNMKDVTGNDEMVLYKLVNASGLGLPPLDDSSNFSRYRPAHGLHLSTNRGSYKSMCLPMFGNNWCNILTMPRLQDLLCAGNTTQQNDNYGSSSLLLLMDFVNMVSEQMKGNMTNNKKKRCE